jgi:type II secretory pathway pseudopilin PulG
MMDSMKRRREQGFTLVELTMSLTFIAFIILFLVSTMLSILQTYNKGIWLNQINQAGRQINSDISNQVRFTKNRITIKDAKQRMCVGNVTYIWNKSGSSLNKYNGETGETKLRLVRILDSTNKYCNDTGLMPNRNAADVNTLLSPGVIIQEFTVNYAESTGLLRVQAVFSTEGGDQPKKIRSDNSKPKIDGDGYTGPTRWQCGQIVGGDFKVGKNQFCAFAEFDIITYRRLGE